jgi:hypothetical protein
MTSVPHERPALHKRWEWLDARDLWVSTAIAAIWLAVLFVGVFGPDLVTTSSDGSSAVVPVGIIVAFFATFATAAVAKYGFTRRD